MMPSISAVLCTIVLRFVDPAVSAMAKMDSIMAGSASVATMASRLLPIPPNADPASKPARIKKERAEGQEIYQRDDVTGKVERILGDKDRHQ